MVARQQSLNKAEGVNLHVRVRLGGGQGELHSGNQVGHVGG